MIQFNKLVAYVESRLTTSGLTLSTYGKGEMLKRFNKKESEGGYSQYWKEL